MTETIQTQLSEVEDLLDYMNIDISSTEFIKPFLNILRTLQSNKKLFSDYKIILNNEEILSHRVVLAIWSPVFRQKLNENPTSLTLNVSPKQAAEFKDMLSFFYSGTLPQAKRESLIALLELANQYQVEALKDLCGQHIADNVNINEVNYLIDIADKYKCESLMRNCGAHIAANFSDYEIDKLVDLNLQVWKGIVMSKEVKVRNEEFLYKAVEKYAAVQKNTKAVMEALIPHLHLHRLPMEFLATVIEPKYGHIEAVHEKLHAVYRQFVTSKIPHHSLPSRTYDRAYFTWSTSRIGSNGSLSNNNMTFAATVAWQQAQADNELLPGNYFEVKIDEMCSPSVNSYGIVVGVGPLGISLNGPTAIIGYSGQSGYGYVANGTTFPASTIPTGSTFGVGSIVKCEYLTNGTIAFSTEKTKQFTLPVKPNERLYPTVAISTGRVTLL